VYWGKASSLPSRRRNTLLRERLCDLLRLDAKQCVPLLTALMALHDIGKFSRPFQAKCPEL
jgi:hypothetical protein